MQLAIVDNPNADRDAVADGPRPLPIPVRPHPGSALIAFICPQQLRPQISKPAESASGAADLLKYAARLGRSG